MQNLWKYLDDLVGKGLDFITIGQFLWYASASLLMLAMPIAILISSIMTFGNLGEALNWLPSNHPVFPCYVSWAADVDSHHALRDHFYFCQLRYPYANLKFVTLYNDIYLKKPAFDLRRESSSPIFPIMPSRWARKTPMDEPFTRY